MADLSHLQLAADSAKGSSLCPCTNSKNLNKNYPPTTPRPDMPKKATPDNPHFWEKHDGGKVFDVYIVHKDDLEQAIKEYDPRPGWDQWAAFSWVGGNDAVIKPDVWPRAIRPDSAPAPDMNLVSTEKIDAIFSNGFQEDVYIHEIIGHGLNALNHGDRHPSMEWDGPLSREEKLALFRSVHREHGYTQIRIQWWHTGIMQNHNDDDLVVN